LELAQAPDGQISLTPSKHERAEMTNGNTQAPDDPQIDLSLRIAQLPIRDWGFLNCPAIPYWSDEYGDIDIAHVLLTLARLKVRGEQLEKKQADEGLSIEYTIAGKKRKAFEFLFGEKAPLSEIINAAIAQLIAADDSPAASSVATASRPAHAAVNLAGDPTLTELALEKAEQFTLPWTTHAGVYDSSIEKLAKVFGETLTDKAIATNLFWPLISNFGLPYNLLVVKKVSTAQCAALEKEFGPAWTAEGMKSLQEKGLLYEIDMRRLASVEPVTFIHDVTKTREVRFTPGTHTLLAQDPDSKELTPKLIALSTKDEPPLIYSYESEAWLYALQAVKTSLTVYGIWLGHVYHWHIVTAAMQMTMQDTFLPDHPLRPLLEQRPNAEEERDYLIDFDHVLLMLLWGQISPPTPVYGYMPLLGLLDGFAEGRKFFDDDPEAILQQLGISPSDFTPKGGKAWEAYPVARFQLEIWKMVRAFAKSVVEEMYPKETEVAKDESLKEWMKLSGDASGGNIRGLQPMETWSDLIKVLTSVVYRVTVHGVGSLGPSVHPTLSFVANFPPCLQSDEMPKPGDKVSTTELLELLPHTGTQGGMTTFYYTFVFTKPYQALIPAEGVKAKLWFPESRPRSNDALIVFRTRIEQFIDNYILTLNAALARLEGGEARKLPPYAEKQSQQWARGIEI